MPARLRIEDDAVVEDALRRLHASSGDEVALRVLVKHYLAVLARSAPGRAVEIRVPPYAAAQVVGGTDHKRGTPPAVVETDGPTWVALATGELSWVQAVGEGLVRASGERSDLSAYLPLRSPA